MSGIADGSHLLGECLQGVAGYEPGCYETVFLEELQQAGHAHFSGVHPTGYIIGRILAAI